MLDLPTIAAHEAAIQSVTCPKLKRLISDCLSDTLKCGLQDLTHVLVVEAGDTEQDIIDAVGFSPLRSRIDNRLNCADWDWIERHDGWWELLYTIGNDGFAYILFVEDAESSPLAQLCQKEDQF